MPAAHCYAVEVPDRNWLAQPLLEPFDQQGVVLALADQVWMPSMTQLAEELDVLTADFTYTLWLGDPKRIEKRTKIWDKITLAGAKSSSGRLRPPILS